MSSLESRKASLPQESTPAPVRFDAPEDNVDPKAKANEEVVVFERHNLTLDTEKRAGEVSASIESKDTEIQALEKKITEVEGALTVLKGNLLDWIFKQRRIKELESELSAAQSSAEHTYGAMLRYAEYAEGFDQVFQEETERAALLEREKIEAKEDAEARDVRKQSIDNNCFFVHAITEEEWKPSANNSTIDTKQASFNDQVALINGLAPTLSASTVNVGSGNRTFNTTTTGAGAGVFLSGGRILAGAPGDIGTVSDGLYKRTTGGAGESKEAIKDAIVNRAHGDQNSYNELIIAQPEIAGVYFRLDSLIDDADLAKLNNPTPKMAHEPADEILIDMSMKDRVVSGKKVNIGLRKDTWSKMAEARTHGVPLYMLTSDNKAYILTVLDPEKNIVGIEAGQRSPEEIMNPTLLSWKDNTNPKERRQKRAEEIFERIKR